MIITQPGEIVPGLYALSSMGVPVFLLDGDYPVLFDAGFACLADHYIEDADRLLDKREPSFCCLTHSHFDHIGAVSEFKARYPQLTVCAAPRVGELMERPSAVERIRMLSSAGEDAAVDYGLERTRSSRPFSPFVLDRPLRDGDEICVARDLTVRVMETPGHTRDCLSYYVPEKKILFASEALGIPDYTGCVVTDFLVDFDMFIESMNRLNRLDIEVLCFGHTYVYTHEDCRGFIPTAIGCAREFCSLVERCLEEEAGDSGRVVERLRAIEYDSKSGPKQPEPAYLMNLEARIAVVRKRLGMVDQSASRGNIGQ